MPHSFFSKAAILAFALSTITLPAQDVTRAQTLTVNARLVVLDVVVTDTQGKPVNGLTEKDFQIFEDEKPQEIRSFEQPLVHQAQPPAGDKSASVLDPARPAGFGVAPVTVLVLDQLNTHFADSSFARRELHDYIMKQPALLQHPTTLLTVYDNNFKQLQPFTLDRATLLKSLEAAPVEAAWQLEVNGKADYGPVERLDQSLRALQRIAQSYAGIRGRKNLIWVGGGFPSIDPQTLDSGDGQMVKNDLQHITNLLLDTRTALYAVDPTSTAATMTEITDATQLQFAVAAGDALAGGSDPFNSDADFDKLSTVTGGRVIRGMNNVAAQIATSVELGSSYYTMSYRPSSKSGLEAAYRRIRVICLRPGVTVATRSGYYKESPAEEKSNDTVSYDLSTAAESAIPLNALHVTVEPNHSVAAEEETYLVHVAAALLTWDAAADGTSVAHVAILAVSVNKQNKMLTHTLHSLTATAHAGVNVHDTARLADFNFQAKASPKATTLRFVVRDASTGKMGSFDLPVLR